MSSTGKRNRAHASPSTSMIPVSPTNPPELPGSVRLPPLSEVLASFDDDDDENLYRPGPKLCVNPNSTVRGWQDLLDSNPALRKIVKEAVIKISTSSEQNAHTPIMHPADIEDIVSDLGRLRRLTLIGYSVITNLTFSTWPDVTSLRFHIEEFVFSHLAGSAGCFVAAITQVCSLARKVRFEDCSFGPDMVGSAPVIHYIRSIAFSNTKNPSVFMRYLLAVEVDEALTEVEIEGVPGDEVVRLVSLINSFKQLRRNTEPMKITVNLVGHSMHAAIALHLISFPIHFEFTITGFGGAEWLNSLFSENWEAIINQLKIHSAYTRSFVLVLRREDVLLTEAYKRLVRDVADLGIHNLAVKVVDGIRSVVEDTSVLNVGDGSS